MRRATGPAGCSGMLGVATACRLRSEGTARGTAVLRIHPFGLVPICGRACARAWAGRLIHEARLGVLLKTEPVVSIQLRS